MDSYLPNIQTSIKNVKLKKKENKKSGNLISRFIHRLHNDDDDDDYHEEIKNNNNSSILKNQKNESKAKRKENQHHQHHFLNKHQHLHHGYLDENMHYIVSPCQNPFILKYDDKESFVHNTIRRHSIDSNKHHSYITSNHSSRDSIIEPNENDYFNYYHNFVNYFHTNSYGCYLNNSYEKKNSTKWKKHHW